MGHSVFLCLHKARRTLSQADCEHAKLISIAMYKVIWMITQKMKKWCSEWCSLHHLSDQAAMKSICRGMPRINFRRTSEWRYASFLVWKLQIDHFSEVWNPFSGWIKVLFHLSDLTCQVSKTTKVFYWSVCWNSRYIWQPRFEGFKDWHCP